MILTYHNINFISKDENTVNVFFFIIHLLKIKFSNKKVVYLSEYDCNNKYHIVLRFDDVDKKTLHFVIPILKILKCPAEFFVVEEFVNSNNGYWADIDDLKNIVKNGHRIQYHSKSHKDLTQIQNEDELIKEITPPKFLCEIDPEGMKYFAYPFGVYNKHMVADLIKRYYAGALSGNGYADSSQYVLDSIKMKNKVLYIK